MSRREVDALYYLHHGLPRQAPGSDASTRRAADLVAAHLPAHPRTLDIGCGPGRSALVLAEHLGANVTAIDIHQPYLDELTVHAQARGLTGRIETRKLSMKAMDFVPRSFDLIWAEGSAYFMGIRESLTTWFPLLKPGGCAAFTELCWLAADPPQEAIGYWAQHYPAMSRPAAHLAQAESLGYRVVAEFTLPASDWWDEYLAPLEARMRLLDSEAHRRKSLAAQIAESRRAIDLFRRYPEAFGYVFHIVAKAAAAAGPASVSASL